MPAFLQSLGKGVSSSLLGWEEQRWQRREATAGSVESWEKIGAGNPV